MAAHQTLAGKYALVRKIATTPTAEVFLAGWKGPSGKDEQVLVKRMLPRPGVKDAVKRFDDEGRIASLLEHPSCVSVIEVGAVPPVRFVVFEHVTGQPLHRVQEAAVKKLGRLPLQHAIGLVLDCASALTYAHQQSDVPVWPLGIVHGAVTPQSILVGYDGIARVVDFGTVIPTEKLADLDGPEQFSRLAYVSPERAAGGAPDKAGDLFALGLVLYELTTGKPAYSGATSMELSLQVMDCSPAVPSKIVPGYPPALDAVVRKAIARDPKNRYGTGRELEVALNGVLQKLGLAVTPVEIGTQVRELFGLGAAPVPAPKKSPGGEAARPDREDTAPVVVGTISPSGKTEPFAVPPGVPVVNLPTVDADVLARLKAELEQAVQREAATRKEADAAKSEARSAGDKLAGIEKQLADAKAEMEAARAAANEADERVEAVKKDAERAAATEAKAEHAIAEAQRIVDGMKKELAALKAQLAEQEKKFAAEREASAAQTKRAIEDAEFKAKKAADLAEQRAKELEKESSATKETEDAAKSEIERAIKERDAAVAAADLAKKEATTAKEELESERWASKTLRDASKKSVESAEMAAEVAKNELGEGIAREALARMRAEEADRRLAAAAAEAEALRTEMERARRDAAKAKAEAAGVSTRVESYKRDAESAKKQIAVLERDLNIARAEINAARRGADMAMERAEALEEELAEIKHPTRKKPPPPQPGPAPTNLTADPGDVVGRGDEMKVLNLLLAEVPVVVLAGGEGAGRTRLARTFAWKWKEAHNPPGGVFHVDVADARDGEGVRAMIARILGIQVPAKMEDDEAIEHLGAEIAGRGEMLLVLDGVDSMSRPVRTLVERWAPAAAAAFLICARGPLGVRDERVVDLKGLALPADGAVDSPASALFAHLMTAHREKKPTDAMMQAIARLVVQLEGNPLAIELAAARTDMFTPAKLLANLGGHEQPQEGGALAWVLDWSWTLLTAWEQEAFAQLSLFRAPFDTQAATDVLDLSGHAGGSSATDALASLKSQGLVQPLGERWVMHPFVRAHAASRLTSSPKRDRALARHEAWALKAARAEDLESIAERSLAIEPPTAPSALSAAKAIVALATINETTGPYTRMLGWLDTVIEQAKRLKLEKNLLSEALAARGSLRRRRQKLDDGLTDLYDAHDLAAGDRDRRFEAKILAEIGLTLQEKGKAEKAKRALEQALAMARGAKDEALEKNVEEYLAKLG